MAARRRIAWRNVACGVAIFVFGVMCVRDAVADKQRRGEHLVVAGLVFAASVLAFAWKYKIQSLPKSTRCRIMGSSGLILGCCTIAAGVLLGFNLVVPYGIALAVIGAGFLVSGMWMRNVAEDFDQLSGDKESRS